MKKAILWILIFMVILASSVVIGSGFIVRHDIILTDFSLSEDGAELTLSVNMLSPMGFVRSYEDIGGGVKPHMLRFYSTFGGLHSSFGAKYTFVLPVSETDTEIYFSRPKKGYQLVLEKNADTGMWQMPMIENHNEKKNESDIPEHDLVYRGEPKELHDLVYRGEDITVLLLTSMEKP